MLRTCVIYMVLMVVCVYHINYIHTKSHQTPQAEMKSYITLNFPN